MQQPATPRADLRRARIAEVLELGQTLFDAAIEAAGTAAGNASAGDPFPEDDLRAAADAFFDTLRLLFDLDGQPA
jgi:hypothetical protein